MHAAMVDARFPDLAALYMLEEERKTWLPVGEVPVPMNAGGRVSLSFVNGGELLVGASGGSLVRRRLADGAVLEAFSAADSQSNADTEWQAACGVHGESSVAHLMLRRESTHGVAWRPEVVVARAAPAADGVVV